MTLNMIYLYFLLLPSAAFVMCENYYSVIAPGVLKSNRKYTVAVTLHASSEPCTISISIAGNSFNASDKVDLQPLETKSLDFFPPKLDGSDYQLRAEGSSGCAFKNESRLYSDGYSGPKIYIQTDKSIYRPLDLVQFRVVILDEHTRPLNIREPIRVEIFDNAGNRVKQFKDIALIKGVFTSKLQLSQQPVMGEWQIRVVLSGKYSHEESKTFTVKLYTLPKFSVYVNAPENFIINDTEIKVEIYGKYTFDRYVEGIVHVELRKYSNDELIQEQVHPIDGLLVVTLQLSSVENLQKGAFLHLKVGLEDKHSGIQKYATSYISVCTERYIIKIEPHEVEYRNNKPFRLKVHIEEANHGPVWDPNTPVLLNHGSRQYETYLNDEGLAVFEFNHQDEASYTVTYKDSKLVLPTFQLYREANEDFYCKLNLKEPARLGKPVEVEVRSSHNIPYLVYIVVGHASIVKMGHVKVPANRKQHTIKITPSVEMIPTSFLYVHYVLDGNLRYEELTLKFPMELENKISVKGPAQAKPGSQVTLTLNGEPGSYVSVMAVDLSVYLLEHSYDIYKETILKDLDEDRSYVPDSQIGKPGILSGLVTLSNAHFPIYVREFQLAKAAGPTVLNFRTKFPETWIFENYEINNTNTELVLNIPETITTWRITAFSNNAVLGMGLVDGPTDITTFLPFFISFNLPYKVKRGEVVSIPVTIFNYHNQSAEAEVTMWNERMQYQFMKPLSKNVSSDQQTMSVQVPAEGGVTVKFFVMPLKIGQIAIRVEANSSLSADGVVKYLNVEPEGVTKYHNEARYLSAADKESSLCLEIPPDSVSDSEAVTLAVGGDFMIPSLDNFHDLVNLPTGCGEQNMLNLAPNILILDYLRATGRLSMHRTLVSKAKDYTEVGYQQQLSYRHETAGYSVFGAARNQEASTWLTAYVARFFIKAAKYISVESRIVDSDLAYLAELQLHDGSFPYTGYIFFTDLQNKYGFTAFVLLAFMEDRRFSRKYQVTVRKGLDYISSNLDNVDYVYPLSIIAAALSKARHSSVNKVMAKLQGYRQQDKNGLMWWGASGNEVETTAYVLFALLDLPGNHLPVLKWLIEQRNRQGGFRSTHDTVVGLEALVKFSQKYNNNSSWDMKIAYSAQDHEGTEVKFDEILVTKNNSMSLQQYMLPNSVRRVNFEITGDGYSLVQLSSQFNVKNDSELKYFTMNAKPNVYGSEDLDLEVCFTYHALKSINNSTNMVIMEVNLPSGFKTDAEFSGNLMENDFIQRVEGKNDETTIVLYFDKLSTDVRHCVSLEAYRANEVTDSKPAVIIMYDYYNTDRVNSHFYTI